MDEYKCYFTCTDADDEYPILPMSIDAPQIGSLFFFEGTAHGYRVIDVQYQLRGDSRLRLVNVILDRITER